MKVFRSWEEVTRNGQVRRLALGFFDGVHGGHRLLFDALQKQSTDPSFSVLTFWPHPQSVLSSGLTPPLITGIEHKLRLFEAAGASSTLLIPFDLTLASLSASTFLQLLQQHLPKLEAVACGPNFRFGQDRTGNAALLLAWANDHGIRGLIPEMKRNAQGQTISSSAIRLLLGEGRLEEAYEALGRLYSLWGKVVRGRQLGRHLGFPTANLETQDHLLLPPGVYAGSAKLENGDVFPAAINIGRRPTVEGAGSGSVLQLEAHLLDYTGGDLYGQMMEVAPLRLLRPEQPFANPGELRSQIAKDVEITKSVATDLLRRSQA